MSADIAIKVRGLKTAYGEHVVHDNLDLDVKRGEVLGVIGPSGTGKSVLLRAIVGLKTPAAGHRKQSARPRVDCTKRRWLDHVSTRSGCSRTSYSGLAIAGEG